MAEDSATARAEWKRYWPLALTAMMGFTFSPTGTFSLGLFMAPLSREFGWSRADISSGLIVLSVFSVLFSSPVGALIDRFGARRIAIPGMALGIIAIASLSLANGSLWQWLALWVLYAVASLFIKTTVWCAAVSKAFVAGRGLALGVVLCGIGLSQTLTPIVAQQLIDSQGWRNAYRLIGFGWGGAILILLLLFFHDVRKAAPAIPSGDKPSDGLTGYTFRQAMRTRPILMILAAVTTSSLISVGISVHLVPIMEEAGLSRSTAAIAAGVAGASAMVGKLVTGVLLDRFRGNLIPFTAFALPALGMAILLAAIPGFAAAGAAAAIIGYAAGANTQSSAYLITRYGGLRSYGAVLGIMSSLIGLSLGIGPWVAGRIFDVTGSYNLLLMIGMPCSVIAGLLLWGLGPYPDFAKNEPDAT